MSTSTQEQIISVLAQGKQTEADGQQTRAISLYKQGVELIRKHILAPSSSASSQVRQLFQTELYFYETKIREMEGLSLSTALDLDNFDDFEEFASSMSISAAAGAATAPKTVFDMPSAPGISSVAPPKTIPAVHSPSKVGSTVPHIVNTQKSLWKGANTKGKQVVYRDNDAVTLNETEKAVLKSSSLICGQLYMPWLPGEEEREHFRLDHAWNDPAGLLPLDTKQVKAGAVWLRPAQYLAGFSTASTVEGKTSLRVSMIDGPLPDPYSVRQDVVGDCSFICSLIIAACYERQAKKRLISGIVYPQDSRGVPVPNKAGKYMVKLHLNGVPRKVLVDDRLPCRKYTTRAGAQLLCASSSREGELWVSIIEKAYMKVNGGYDFAGSNSGIDLFALTGWIPEQVYLQKRHRAQFCRFKEDDADDQDASGGGGGNGGMDHRQSKERAWERMLSAHQFGDCLITVSTSSELTAQQQTDTGLIPGHAYAVLDVKQAGSLQMLKIKNPWAESPWLGRFSSRDVKAWTTGLLKFFNLKASDFKKMEQEGVFFIEFADMLQYFTGIFLNWNPTLFSFRTTLHDFWPLEQGPRNDHYYKGDNPQYSLIIDPALIDTTKMSGSVVTVWVLLSRHVTSSKDEDNEVFLAIHIYRIKGGKRVYDGTWPRPYIKGVYSNNPHDLVRLDVDISSSEGSEFTLVLSQMDRTKDVSYTLGVYGTTAYRFQKTPGPGQYKYDFGGKFSLADQTSGGSPNEPTFYQNPQFALTLLAEREGSASSVSRAKRPSVHIEAFSARDVSTSLHLVKVQPGGPGSGGSLVRLDSLSALPHKGNPDPPELVVVSSGAYKKGYTHLPDVSLEPGTPYCLVLSNYSSRQEGSYKINVLSDSERIRCEPLRCEGASAATPHHQQVTGTYKDSERQGGKGGVSRYAGLARLVIKYPVGCKNLRVILVARLRVQSGTPVSQNLSLFPFPLDLPPSDNAKLFPSHPSCLQSSCDGVYWDGASGCCVEYRGILSDSLCLIPSCFDSGNIDYVMDIHTSHKVSLQWHKSS